MDDDPLILRALARSLRRSIETIEFFSPVGALAWCENHAVQGAIVDFRMPGMDGIELTRLLTRRFPGMPVLLLSGDLSVVTDEEREEMTDAGVTFASKPWEATVLAAFIERVRNA